MSRIGVLTRFFIVVVLGLGVVAECAASVEPELTMAVRNKNVRQVQALLAQGVDIEERDEGLQQTPLMRAAQVGEPTIVRILLAHRADVHARDDAGNTALMFAVERGDVGIARLLLARGADPYAQDAQGHSALSRALLKRLKPMLALLQQAGKPRRGLPPLSRYAANSTR